MKRLLVALLLLACIPVAPHSPPVPTAAPASGAALEPAAPRALPWAGPTAPRPSRAVQRPAPSPTQATRSRHHTIPKVETHGQQPTEAQWARLRFCENGGRYTSSPGDTFRGAYQFSRGTWKSVGGSGDPADAPAAEQDARAKLLYQSRGRQPWPVCGRFLR